MEQLTHLLLEASDGLLVPAEVHPGDAEAAEGGGLHVRHVPGLSGGLELLLVALAGDGVLAERQVHVAQVAVRLALAAGVADVLQDRELLKASLLLSHFSNKL